MGERKAYKPRGKRETHVGRINLQFPRDLDILQDIYRHKALTVHQIHLMHFGSSRSPAQLRITKLFNHKFIHQIVIPVGYHEPGSNPIFNVLDAKGTELLMQYREPELKWHFSDKDLTDRFLNHAKLLNDFYATVIRACRDHGYGYPSYDEDNRLIKRTDKELKVDKAYVEIRAVTSKRESVSFRPDTYFQVRVKGEVFSFFVEADNKNEKRSDIITKFRAYRAYYENGMYKDRYGSKQPFRVLFITDGIKRIESLKKWANEDNAGENFWFAHTGDTAPNSVLHDPIWHVASWAGTHSLFK